MPPLRRRRLAALLHSRCRSLLTGTLGAVIRIRETFPPETALFDIGVAGPIAGFVVLLPVLFSGWRCRTSSRRRRTCRGLALGEPLLFKLAPWLKFGTIPDGQSLNMHPMVFAAWFGMLATALNLLPFGQLDGGHITYATLGGRVDASSRSSRRSRPRDDLRLLRAGCS